MKKTKLTIMTTLVVATIIVCVCCNGQGSSEGGKDGTAITDDVAVATADSIKIEAADSVEIDSSEGLDEETLWAYPDLDESHNWMKKERSLTQEEMESIDFTGYDFGWCDSTTFVRCWFGSKVDSTFIFLPKEEAEECPYYSTMKCPKCGNRVIVMYFESDIKSWQNLCGIAGYLPICTHCKKAISFYMTVIN